MKLNILHRVNLTGDSLINYFRNAWDRVACNQFEMDGNSYYDITAEHGRGPVSININRARAFMNSVNPEMMEGILSLNGIQSSFSKGEILSKSYEVLILDRSILSIRQIVYGKSSISKKYIDDEPSLAKITDLAKRSMYLLGLDYAMISIAQNRLRKMKVIDVDASPALRDKDLYDLIQRLEEYKNEFREGWPAAAEIKLGADPEFMIANSKNGKMVPASEFFPRDGIFGCDNIRIPSRQQRPVAELRPKPDTSPVNVYSNIKQALELANKKVPYKNIKWLAGSQPFSGYSIGGHIHFSNLPLNNQSLRALDNYLGLPVFLLEDQATAVKRRHKYGQLGEYRNKEYGGFEYRTLGSWLISPEITLAVLCLAKIVSSNFRVLNKNYFMTAEAQRAFYKGDQQYFKQAFEDIWRDIQRLEMYQEYKQQLEPIPTMISGNTCWDEKIDIRKSWSLSKVYTKIYTAPRQPAKATVSNTSVNNNTPRNNTINRRSSRSGSNSSSQTIPVAAVNHYGSTVNALARANPNYPGSYL